MGPMKRLVSAFLLCCFGLSCGPADRSESAEISGRAAQQDSPPVEGSGESGPDDSESNQSMSEILRTAKPAPMPREEPLSETGAASFTCYHILAGNAAGDAF